DAARARRTPPQRALRRRRRRQGAVALVRERRRVRLSLHSRDVRERGARGVRVRSARRGGGRRGGARAGQAELERTARPRRFTGRVRGQGALAAAAARRARTPRVRGAGDGRAVPLARRQSPAARAVRTAGRRRRPPAGACPGRRRVKLLDVTEFYSPQGGGVRTYLPEKAGWLAPRHDVQHVVVVPSKETAVMQWERARVYLVRGHAVPARTGHLF